MVPFFSGHGTHKANLRLHLLRQLKRAAVSQRDMLHFYIGVIHPVLEYAVAVWHSGLIAELSDQLKTIQKRAFRIILGGSSFSNQSYESFCHNLEILPLSTRRDQLASHFFTNSYTQPAVLFITLSLSKPTILKLQS